MYKLKTKNEIDQQAKTKHTIAISLELAMVVVSIGYLIYVLSTGDPNNRTMACIGSAVAFLLPLCIEQLFKVRFSFMQHLLCNIYMILTVFLGSACYWFTTVGPYDEIGHFLFGYFSSLFFWYMFLAWDGSKSLNLWKKVLGIFLLSMSIASIWEILEFSTDLFLNQNSLGYADPAIIEAGKAEGLTGVALSIYILKNGISVWDTITDMTLHFGGTILFLIEYLIAKAIKTPIILGNLKKEYYNHRNQYYTYIDETKEEAEPTLDTGSEA